MRCGLLNRERLAAVTLLLAMGIPESVLCEDGAAQTLKPEHVEFFEKKIRPVLLRHCYKCHSADAKNVKGGLLLDARETVLKGGDTGPAVVPRNVAKSLLISALRQDGLEMPPEGKLPDAVIADFVKWIEMGAPDPRVGPATAKSQIDFEQAGKFWAFQPIEKPPVPKVRRTDWPRTDIDHFTMSRMEQMRLVPVEAATKREWIRRATFDLIGLPPQPKHIDAFVADQSPQAYDKVIERLLNSEHYGERWGRYWLDVARYSEDQAHTFSVRKNTNGFRYRDWVVSAFNSDMPYDKFVKLQIAGDLIGPDGEGSYDHLIALGFFGLGAQYYKNSDAAQAAADELDDRVDTLSRGFLGITVSCARCHDHKFDPIPTQDYYSLAGIFRSSKLNNAPLCAPEDIQSYNAGRERIKKSEAAVKKFLAVAKATAAESKVGDISKYMQTVWKYQVAAASGQSVNISELAAQAGLNAFLLKRWIGFLDHKRQGQVRALDDWFALKSDVNGSVDSPSGVPLMVAKVTDGFQKRLQRLLGGGEGVATTNLVDTSDGKPHAPGSPRFVTPLVTKVRPTAGIDVDIRQATQLFLVVSDGGNGKSCDHADWIAPRLTGPTGELDLTQVKWKSLDGFGGGRINKNYQGRPIRAGGKTYPRGVGVHAPTTIVYELPAGYERFQVIGALDNSGSDQAGGCGDQASVQFSVYTEKPVVGPVAPGKDLLTIVLGKDGPLAVNDKDLESFLEGDKRQQLAKVRAEFEEAKKTAPAMYPIAHAYAEGNVADMRVFVRGDPARKREIAPRRFLRILAGEKRPLYTKGSGRRQLAEAIASAENPLTVRVIVNRIWQHHFGRGIVATPSNFGKLGDAPTHPQLLDYLAAGFIDSGWSIKHVHRQIMLSATYRLSTSSHLANTNIDADNRFLWKMTRRRLDVEAWRDALLDVSGRLDRTRGGPSTNLADANNVRRTIYAQISRHELDGLLRLFDFPDANITSAKRSETTVPQQQLFVLNSPFMIAQARAFSARLHREAPDSDEARIRRAFSLAYSRSPSAAEVMLGLDYLGGKPDPDNKLTNWETYAQVLLGANEFIYLD